MVTLGNELQSAKANGSSRVKELGRVKFVNELQPAKAAPAMTVTELGMITFANELQPLKAPFPITVTESGMVTLGNELQYAKANCSSRVKELGRVKFVNELQSAKAAPAMTVTESGMVTVANELQALKAKPPITATELGMVTLANELQPSKARTPIRVTESGMVTFANELHLQKAKCSISVTPPGISTTRKSSRSTLEDSKLKHVTGLMLRKARTFAPGIALDTSSALFNSGLSPTTTSTELMLRFASSSQGSHTCSCLLNSLMVVSMDTSNDSAFPDSCRTVIALAIADFFLATNYCLKRCSSRLAWSLLSILAGCMFRIGLDLAALSHTVIALAIADFFLATNCLKRCSGKLALSLLWSGSFAGHVSATMFGMWLGLAGLDLSAALSHALHQLARCVLKTHSKYVLFRQVTPLCKAYRISMQTV